MNYAVSRILAWIQDNKLIVFLATFLIIFVITTLVLSSDKSEIFKAYEECKQKLQECEKNQTKPTEAPQKPSEPTTTTTTTTTTSTTTTEDGGTTQSTSAPTTEKPKPSLNYRLSDYIQPFEYELFLKPDLKTGQFEGKAKIHLNITKATDTIKLHSHKLKIENVEFIVNSGSKIEAKYSLSPEEQFLIIVLSQIVSPSDAYALEITFSADLLNRIVGFYRSSYLDQNNLERFIATSKFEPTYARQAFPCFDEPAMKAKFTISLVRPKDDGYHALSNMNEVRVEESPDKQAAIVHFATSVPMSTYLACFIVSDFKEKHETVSTNNIGKPFQMRVFATPAQLDKVDFALQTGVKITEYFIKYFQIEYPLPKLDMVAIPDFVSGAMEHWGLVTFRETSLLYHPNISATANKERVASVVAHELAHMWFGNLVTMAWWNELWLNEGFATYLQYKGVHNIYPDWGILDHFLINTLQPVMNLDATFAAHPIVQTADNPDQITELFDSITYSKGASVIRMLADFVGEENFAKSVTNYLNAHKYSNAVTDDLLTQIENIHDSNKDVKYIMSTWTKQSGLPVVNVTRVSNTEYTLTQKRFLSNPANENVQPEDSEFKYRWTIPITYTTDVNPNQTQRAWFQHNDIQTSLQVPADHKWIKLNKDQVGYYRVNYPVEQWKTLSEVLVKEPNVFSVADRSNLLNDAFSLAEATQLSYDIALDLTQYLEKETEYVPWSVAVSKLSVIRRLLYYTKHYPKFLKYARKVVDLAYKKVGWTVDDNHNQNLLRVEVLHFACTVNHNECLTYAGKEFNKWLNNQKQRPPPDLRSVIYTYGMRINGNENNWNKVWGLYLSEPDAQEKAKLLQSLASTADPSLLKQFIDLAWDEKNVRSQDYFSCLQLIAANQIGEPIVWEYVRENWKKLTDRFGLNERYLGSMIPSIVGRFSTTTKLEEVQSFFKKHPEAGAGATARKEATQKIENNIQWLKNNEKSVGNWLETATKNLEQNE